jgi:hypothetical protein
MRMSALEARAKNSLRSFVGFASTGLLYDSHNSLTQGMLLRKEKVQADMGLIDSR